MSSIRGRILWPLLPLTALLLLATGMVIAETARHDLLAGVDRTLLAMAKSVGAAVDVEPDGTLEFEHQDADFGTPAGGSGERFYAVVDEKGMLLASSREVPSALPPELQHPDAVTYQVAQTGGRRFRVCTLPLQRTADFDDENLREGASSSPEQPVPTLEVRRVWVTVGYSLAVMETTLAAFRTRLATGLGTLLLLLVLIPVWTVSRALGPLRRLALQAETVGPQSPGSRLCEEDADWEVRTLVVALNRAFSRLDEACRRQEQFTVDAVHRLRTPLRNLASGCTNVLARSHAQPELRHALESAYRTALGIGVDIETLLVSSGEEATRADSFGAEQADTGRGGGA